MSQIRIYILLISMAGGKILPAQQPNDSVFQPVAMQSFRLLDAEKGKYTTLKDHPFTEPLLLFVFLSPECPLCKNYMPVLNDLQRQYPQTVKIIGIIPGKTYTTATVKAFARKYKTSFPLFTDDTKKMTDYLHAAVTPEVILLNTRYELVYKGAIDNRVQELGVKRWQATENYLSDAVSQWLQHSAVAVKRIKATGCLINDF
jgi:thiol-disulfide isomerase/thioredoxin